MDCIPAKKMTIVIPTFAQIWMTMTHQKASVPPRNSDWRPNQLQISAMGPPRGSRKSFQRKPWITTPRMTGMKMTVRKKNRPLSLF